MLEYFQKIYLKYLQKLKLFYTKYPSSLFIGILVVLGFFMAYFTISLRRSVTNAKPIDNIIAQKEFWLDYAENSVEKKFDLKIMNQDKEVFSKLISGCLDLTQNMEGCIASILAGFAISLPFNADKNYPGLNRFNGGFTLDGKPCEFDKHNCFVNINTSYDLACANGGNNCAPKDAVKFNYNIVNSIKRIGFLNKKINTKITGEILLNTNNIYSVTEYQACGELKNLADFFTCMVSLQGFDVKRFSFITQNMQCSTSITCPEKQTIILCGYVQKNSFQAMSSYDGGEKCVCQGESGSCAKGTCYAVCSPQKN